MRIGMSILVRDEVDIIEDNIRFHANQGIDSFVVTDNGSTDGTREVLESLKSEHDIFIIDEPSFTIDQDLWVTRMARHLQQSNKVDWLVNNDADEFWVFEDNDFSSAITRALDRAELAADDIGLLYCPRSNMVPSRESTVSPDYTYRDNCFRVKKTLVENDKEKQWHENNSNILIRTLPGKVITRLDGLHAIDMGNHGAEHDLARVKTDTIHILHYPIRTYRQFEKKVVNYGRSLENNQRFAEKTSRHLRYWYQQFKQGQLKQEYQSFVLPQNEINGLISEGILVKDDTLSRS